MKLEKVKKITREQQAIEIINKHKGKNIELAYSGGKDSDVLLDLAKKSDVEFTVVHRFTTIESKEQIKQVAKARKDCEALGIPFAIIRPKKTFYQSIQTRGLPTRMRRWCCESLKHDSPYFEDGVVLTGVRKAESNQRMKNAKEENQLSKIVLNVNPIVDFSDEYLFTYIDKNKIELCKTYKKHRRVGCVGCVLASPAQRKKEFDDNPKILKAIIKSAGKYLIYRENKRAENLNKYKKELLTCNEKRKLLVLRQIKKLSLVLPFKNGEEYVNWWLGNLSINSWIKEKEYQERLKKLF